MKRIIVTGGTGFLGSNLCIKLINDGNIVICIDNNYTGNMENIDKLMSNKRFIFVNHDICKPLDISVKIDQIYNLACPASPYAYQGEHSIDTIKICVVGTLNILELAKKNNATMLQASTSEVYGDPLEHPQREDYYGNVNPIGVRSCYDEGKRCAESLIFNYWKYEGVDIKVVRIFNTYGPNMDINDGRVVSNFICQALTDRDITVYGNGTQTRSFCYVDDLIDAMIRMMNSQKGITGPINIGNPSEFSIYDLANIILSKVCSKSKIVYKKLPEDDPVVRCPDITLARKKLGWVPKISLDKGLDRTILYFKNKIKNTI